MGKRGRKIIPKLHAKDANKQANDLFRQAHQLQQEGNLYEAEQAFKATLTINPNHYSSLLQLAHMACQANRLPLALGYAQKTVQINHADAEGHLVLGLILSQLGLVDAAESALSIAQQLNATDDRILNTLGRVFTQQGRIDDALTLYREAISLAPNNVSAYFDLTVNKKFQQDDPDIRLFEQLKKNSENFSHTEKTMLHFALGKVRHDCGEYDQAFDEYQQANRLKKETVSYNHNDQVDWVNALIDTFDETLVTRLKGAARSLENPVFVLGMPRSGTTLAESLLCRHPDVCSIGEVPYLRNLMRSAGQRIGEDKLYPQSLGELAPAMCEELGKEYITLSRQFGVSAKCIVDKMPENFLFIGFILSVFPQAKIIHCVRNPVDTCLSMYQQFFSTGLEYSYDLKDLGQFYLLYRRVMGHWSKLFPDQIFDIAYENVVEDTAHYVQKLIDYCDLPWDEKCLASQERDDGVNVRTASTWQVRQPVHQSSVQRWRHYEKHLGPLLEVLEPILTEAP